VACSVQVSGMGIGAASPTSTRRRLRATVAVTTGPQTTFLRPGTVARAAAKLTVAMTAPFQMPKR
jgi:hypothetical protein